MIQHRRLIQDDIRGVEEPLNERDANKQGIRVNARYYMHIYDTFKGENKQRRQQMVVDQPIQYFFSLKYNEPTDNTISVTPFESKIQSLIPKDFSTFVY